MSKNKYISLQCQKERNSRPQRGFGIKLYIRNLGKLMWCQATIRSINGISARKSGLPMSCLRECQWGFLPLMKYGDGTEGMES